MTVAEYNSKYGEIPLKRPANVTIDQWDKAVNLYNVAKSKGDKFPELTVAQAALETGWFKSPSGSFNYFGQKATQSQKGTDFNTKEVSGNQAYSTRARFRDYENLGEAVDDRVKKWSSKYANAENIDQAIGSIWQYDPQTGQGKGYATDDKYDVKLKSILGMMGVESDPSQPRQEPIINTEVSNLQNTQQIPTFASNVPPLPIQPTKEEEKAEKKVEKEEDSKEKNALKQKQKEYEFLQEAIAKLTEVPQQRQQEQPQQEELRIPDIMQRYNEVSKVVETPVLQQGGVIKDQQGQRAHPNEITEIQGNTMSSEGYGDIDLFVVPNIGEPRIIKPNTGTHIFKGATKFTEYPIK